LHLVIGDLSLALAQRKTNDHKTAIALDIYDNEQRKAIENADMSSRCCPLICILK
jgi:hypothetical protein